MNKEITIYELLGLIKDGQAPERIVYDNYIWSWTGDDYHTNLKTNLTKLSSKYIKNDLLNILNKGE